MWPEADVGCYFENPLIIANKSSAPVPFLDQLSNDRIKPKIAGLEGRAVVFCVSPISGWSEMTVSSVINARQ